MLPPIPETRDQMSDLPLSHEAEVRMIEGRGGKVVRDPTRPHRPVVSVDLSGTPLTGAELLTHSALTELRSLDVTEQNTGP